MSKLFSGPQWTVFLVVLAAFFAVDAIKETTLRQIIYLATTSFLLYLAILRVEKTVK